MATLSGPFGSLPLPTWLKSNNNSESSSRKSLTAANINPHVKQAQYAVRGELAIKSERYRDELAQGKKLPFDSVVSANIGNPQQLGQKPLTFFRQVASLLENPRLLDQESVLTKHLGYPSDVISRARRLLKDVSSVGAYSQSQGGSSIRQSIADYIERRDGYKSDKENIYCSNGASGGVSTLMHIICASETTAVLVPIPQYPLYTATLTLLNARAVPYYLEEDQAWATNLQSIKDAIHKARANGTDVRAIVVINPGNPTGASLSKSDISSVLQLAAEENVVVIADEVYQTNVFQGSFVSFRKCLYDMQKQETDASSALHNVELASLHSISKGMIGECGHRGGYFELVGFEPEVKAQIYKYISIQLCPPVIGQCMVEMMVNPPQPGEPSYDLYKQEYDATFTSLLDRANALYAAFQKMDGVKCQSPQGSMYLFPTITIPGKAAREAEQQGKSADAFYCGKLLDATGVCVVPGSGFGQKPGTLHFRTTFLAPGTEWVQRIVGFHQKFMDEYR